MSRPVWSTIKPRKPAANEIRAFILARDHYYAMLLSGKARVVWNVPRNWR